MCRFKPYHPSFFFSGATFKYIICVGSSNGDYEKALKAIRFKYIICVGSSGLSTIFQDYISYLNTSYVSVQESGNF